jgi:hypothetical protein
MAKAATHVAPSQDLAAFVERLVAGAGKAAGAPSGSSKADPPARARGAVRCAPTPLPAGAIAAAAALRLGATSEDLPRWHQAILAALDRAEQDYADYRGMTSRSPLLRKLRRLQRLADAATRGMRGAHAKLYDQVGDGVEFDRDIDTAMGIDTDDPVSMVARAFADRPSPHSAGMLAGTVERAVSFATPRSRARRGLKLFAVVHLAISFAILTGRRPTYSSDAEGGRIGDFPELVTAIDNEYRIDDDGRGFDEAIRVALRLARLEIDAVVALRELGLAAVPARLGSPSFLEGA